MKTSRSKKINTVAIIGSGFSGLMVASQLIKQATAPFCLLVFDGSFYQGRGIAYATLCPQHLLNVPAGRMGAWPDHPEDFYRWLERASSQWRQKYPELAHLEVSPHAYVPRMLFGEYLESIKQGMEAAASEKKIEISWLAEEVINVEKIDTSYRLYSREEKQYSTDFVVVCTGTPPTKNIPSSAESGYLQAPWPEFTQMESVKALLGAIPCDGHVGIIGSGLTMLDVLVSLDCAGFKGKISVISRKNAIPLSHQPYSHPLIALHSKDLPSSALGLFAFMRRLSKKIGSWRCAIDSLRPIALELWQRFSVSEKKFFLRRLYGIWNIHRHRAPVELFALVEKYKNENRLNFIKARAEKVYSERSQVFVALKDQAGFFSQAGFNLVINCSGPDFNIAKIESDIIQNLLKKQYIELDETNTGILKTSEGLFVVGPLLLGHYFPEIRQLCYEVASDILVSCAMGPQQSFGV